MSDSANIVLVIFLIFFISMGLIFFFNITLRYIGKLNKADVILVIIVIVAGLLFAINLLTYSKGYADTRNAQRSTDVQIIADSVGDYISVYRYRLNELGGIPTCPTIKKIGTASGNINLQEKMQETNLATVPFDPSVGNDSDTGYTICSTQTGRIVVNAPAAENGKVITAKK